MASVPTKSMVYRQRTRTRQIAWLLLSVIGFVIMFAGLSGLIIQ